MELPNNSKRTQKLTDPKEISVGFCCLRTPQTKNVLFQYRRLRNIYICTYYQASRFIFFGFEVVSNETKQAKTELQKKKIMWIETKFCYWKRLVFICWSLSEILYMCELCDVELEFLGWATFDLRRICFTLTSATQSRRTFTDL